jgi:hypothetical protein
MVYAFDDEIKSIKSQLDALGWDGKTQSENPAISSLLEKAEYRVMQLRENNVKAYRDSLKSTPSWLLSIASGATKGVENFSDSI